MTRFSFPLFLFIVSALVIGAACWLNRRPIYFPAGVPIPMEVLTR